MHKHFYVCCFFDSVDQRSVLGQLIGSATAGSEYIHMYPQKFVSATEGQVVDCEFVSVTSTTFNLSSGFLRVQRIGDIVN